MTRLRTAEGIDLDEVAARFGSQQAARVVRHAEGWIRAGGLRREGSRLAVPPRRLLVSDAVIEELFETQDDTQPSETEMLSYS